jgi:hypothetical protein
MLNDNPPDRIQSDEDRSAENQQRGTQAFRTVIRSVRFTPEEWTTVQEHAAEVGLSPSRYLRQAALRTPFARRVNRDAIVALNRVGVNLNNMIRIAIRSGQSFLAAEAEDVLSRLRKGLESFL